MEQIFYPVWLAMEAMSAMFSFWHVTLALIVGFALTLFLRSPFIGPEARFHRRHLLVLSPLAVTFLILLWGTVMRHSGSHQSVAPSWPVYVVHALLIVQLVVSIWVVFIMKGYRWFSVFTVALELWFGLVCALLVVMSVTGDWL